MSRSDVREHDLTRNSDLDEERAGQPPVGRAGEPWGRSCHTAAELVAAERDGARWATVSPVFPTVSKPGYGPPLGRTGLAALASRTMLPVYALGGVDAGNAAACRGAGAAGVAVMGAVMRAPAPGRFVADLLDSWRARQVRR